MVGTKTATTAEELLRLPDSGEKHELVRGGTTEDESCGRAARKDSDGTHLVWVVCPGTRSVVVHKSLKDTSTLTATDTLNGGEVAPGFELPVAEVFE